MKFVAILAILLNYSSATNRNKLSHDVLNDLFDATFPAKIDTARPNMEAVFNTNKKHQRLRNAYSAF